MRRMTRWQRLPKTNDGKRGHAFIISLLVLCLGGILIPTLLSIAHTGVTSERMYEKKMRELYAADVGIEDTIFRIANDDPTFADTEIGESVTYTLPDEVDNLEVTVTTTNSALLAGMIGDTEYADGRPHQDFVSMTGPFFLAETGPGYVVYSGSASFDFAGTGIRRLDSIGAFFYPAPDGSDAVISDPYDISATGALSGKFGFVDLRGGKAETKVMPGAFAFIWRWDSTSSKPMFCIPPPGTCDTHGDLTFKFRVDEPGWEPTTTFVWTTWKEADVAFATNCKMEKWLIESQAGNTMVRAVVLDSPGTPTVISWEINPP